MQDNNEWKNICAACAEGTPPERCAYYGDPSGCNAPTLGAHPEGNLAERLQEALEKAERRIAELERALGNAAALREALESCLDFIRRIDRAFNPFMQGLLEDAVAKANAALAAPPRNCERFDSWEDAYIAWVKETQDCAEHPIDWGERPGDTYEAAQELWMHYFKDDQNREFCDWLWELEEAR